MDARTTDDRDDQGEIVGVLRRVADILPSPDQLVVRDDTVNVTLALSRRSVDFFKREAAKQKGALPAHDPGIDRRVHAADGVSQMADQRALRLVRKRLRRDVSR